MSEELDLVARELRRSGVREVAGIGADDSLFAPDVEIAGRSSTRNPYDAPVTALAVNFNTVNVVRMRDGVRSAERVHRHRNSRDLRQVLAAMLERSSNFVANDLFLLLGEAGDGRPLTMAAAQQAMTIWATRRFGWQGHRIEDGAGLSPGNPLSARRRTHGRGGCGRRDATQPRLPSRFSHCPPVPIPVRRECRSPQRWFMLSIRPLWIARQEMSGGVQAGGVVGVILVVRYRQHRRPFRGVNF